MKKTISTVIIVLSFFMANAQIERGAKSLGFNLAAIYENYKSGSSNNSSYSQTSTNTGFAIQPFFDYFVGKNLSLGIALNYSNNFVNNNSTNSTFTSNSNSNLKSYGLQVQLTKYWFASNKVAFTFRPAVASLYFDNIYEYTGSNVPTEKNSSSFWQHGIGGNVGVAYFIKKNVMVEGQTNFFSYIYRPVSNSSNLTISIIPTNLTLGFKFIFGNKANNVKVN